MSNDKPLRLFVAMPGTTMGTTAQWKDPEQIKRHFFQQIQEQLESKLHRKVEMIIEKDKVWGGPIHPSMFQEAWEADVYIADLTGNNPNVYLELGVRWAVKDGVTVVVSQEVVSVLFNASASRIIPYEMDFDNIEQARDKVVQAIIQGLEKENFCDSPVRQNAKVLSYPREYVEGLEKQIKKLNSEYVRNLINMAEDPKISSLMRLDLLSKAISENEYLDKAYFLRGVEKRKLADYKDAITDLQKAVSLNTNLPSYHRELAIAYNKNGQLEEAVPEFDESLRIEPDDAETWRTRGGVLRKLGMQNIVNTGNWHYLLSARDSYKKAFELDKVSNYALGNIARLNLLISKFDNNNRATALKDLQRLKSLCEYKLYEDDIARDDKYWLMFDYADSYLLSGDVDQGVIYYNQAVAEVPEEYRKSVLSSVMSPLEELVSFQVLDDQVNTAIQNIVRQFKPIVS